MELKSIPVEISARHVHLSAADVAALFGAGHSLTAKRDLSQPGQFVSEERVSLIGPRCRMDNVAVLGPERKATQVEISLTDARALGVSAPVRESGDTAGSGGIVLEGPAGQVTLTEGVIAAKRHIHIKACDAERLGVADKQIVSVRVDGPRALVFDETVCRVSADFETSMHIDVDEGNAAAGANTGVIL